MFNHFAVSALVTSITTFLLAIFIFSRSSKTRLNKVFALYSLSISVWAIFVFLHGSTSDKSVSLFAAHALHIGAIFIPVLFIHFLFILLKDPIVGFRRLSLIFMYGLAAFFETIVFTPLFVKEVTPRYGIKYLMIPGGVFYYLWILFFSSCVAYGAYRLYREYSVSTGMRRNQLKYLFWSSLFGYIGGMDNFLIINDIKIFPLFPYGSYAVTIYVGVATYAILRYRLMDITVAITRTGIFVVVYTMILGLPFILATGMRQWLIDILGTRWWMFPLGLMGALATVGPFIYIYFERKAEDRLLREQRRYQQTLKQASVGMTRIRNLQKLLELITHIVTKTVKISYVAIYLYNSDLNDYVLQVHRDKGRIPVSKVSPDNPLIKWIIKTREPLIYEEVKRMMEDSSDELHRLLEENMRMLTASVVIPSFLEDRSIGFIVLGDKVSGQIYSMDDLNVFQVLASQAALAIENAQFYEEAKEMQEQIAQAEKMATIGTMADGLSHQINNRFNALSLIAGDSIDTIKMTDTSKCTPEVQEMLGQINHALDRIQTNVIQGGEVVRGLLRYSRKEDVGFEALDLNTVINNTLDMVRYKIKLSEFDLVRNFHDQNIKIQGNMVHLQEAFFNFIDNAYDAIMERRNTLKEAGYRGSIVVASEPAGEYLKITVQDNGMGVKEGHIQKIFTPFFTTKTSSRKGTGLGLYVIKRIITDTHKGKLAFESEYKAGTKFTLELPIAK